MEMMLTRKMVGRAASGRSADKVPEMTGIDKRLAGPDLNVHTGPRRGDVAMVVCGSGLMEVCEGLVERGSRWKEERRALPAMVHSLPRQGFWALIVGCTSIFVLGVEISTNFEPTTLPECGEEKSKSPSTLVSQPLAYCPPRTRISPSFTCPNLKH